jgi:single stranded DNA-binding protein
MRKIIVSGRLAANAEIKITKNGTQFIEFRMANNEYSFGNSNTENGKDTCWFRVVSFNQNHAKLQQYLTKGKPIEVVGDLTVSPYISNVTNKPEAGLEIRANDIMFDNNFGTQNNQQNNNNTITEQTSTPSPTPAAVQPKKTAPRNPSTTTTKPIQSPIPTPTPTEDDGTDDLPF